MNRKGFTLIEMMVVLAIAAILTTMAGTSLNMFFYKNSLITEIATVAAAFTSARSSATSLQQCVVVTTSANSIQAISYTPGNSACTAPMGSQQAVLVNTQLDAGYTLSPFSTGGNVVTFNIIGGLTTNNVVTFTLSQNGGGQSSYKIYPAIGQIRWTDP